MVDVLVHVDETLDHDGLENVTEKIRENQGIIAADFHDDKPHLIMVEYNPDAINSSSILHTVKAQGLHAELVGL